MNRNAVNPAECVKVGRHDVLKASPEAWALGTFPAANGERQYYSETEYFEVACCSACTSLVAREVQS